jgi:lysine-N-methylase
MSFPIRQLPVIQNWDCHICGSCCKEYVVKVTDEERRRIEAQGWDKDPELAGQPLFKKTGPWWGRRYTLNHREDGSCVFLSEQGRCRIHEKFGYDTKPLPCRMFPFVLVPAGDHWRIGMRFACPSAAGNKGRTMTGHSEALKQFAAALARREGLDKQPDLAGGTLPRLQPGQRVEWPDLLRLVQALLTILRNQRDSMERRLRKCLALASLCRQARFDQLQGKRLAEFLQIVTASLEGEVPADPVTLPPPNWVGRVFFRQAIALFTRKDHGPDRGVARQGRTALLRAAWRFAVGRGQVPRLHMKVPETTFEQVEAASGVLPPEAEEVLERYYTVKVESLQFFGATNFKMPFWDGLEMLTVTFPVLMWVTRALTDLPRTEAVMRALTIVDDHFGFNPVLRSRRQQLSFRILARTGQLVNLVAWYGR